jgi:hypothetical protein
MRNHGDFEISPGCKTLAGERGCGGHFDVNLEPNPHAVGCNAPQELQIIQKCDTLVMDPLNTWTLEARSRIKGIFTDVDDTLTTDGAITPDALAALVDLKARGLRIIAITGRPVGWSEPFAISWPVDAIVAEHGSFCFRICIKIACSPIT